MAIWRCYSQHGMELIESDETPSNSARQCVLESGDPGDKFLGKTLERVRLPDSILAGLGPGPEHSLAPAFVPVFRPPGDPVGPTPEDPFTDPTMAEVSNPPRSPVTNLLQGPWAGKTTVTSNGGINPKFSFGASDDEMEASGGNWFKRNNAWLILLAIVAGLYAWKRLR